jgi:hypothetical protein
MKSAFGKNFVRVIVVSKSASGKTGSPTNGQNMNC